MNEGLVGSVPSSIARERHRHSVLHSRVRRHRRLWMGLKLLFIVAVLLRFYHLASYHGLAYAHDAISNAAYVGYVRVHHRLPPVDAGVESPQQPLTDEGIEYPQQPLYYVLASVFDRPGRSFDQNEENRARFGFCLSVASLYLAFLSLRHLSSWLLRYGLFVFLAFTPSFVLASSYVGNDGLVVFFGALYFLSLLRLNRNPQADRYFILAVGALLGALLTKLNGIVLLAALPWLFWRKAWHELSWKPTAARFAVVALLITFWAGGVLFRAWSPAKQQFIFTGARMWDFMDIKENLVVYALRFDLSSLISAGQATTTHDTPDQVRFSFPSWEYGNMLLGEYRYNNDPVLLFGARQEIVAGTYLLFGLVLFTFVAAGSQPLWPWQNFLSLNRTALLLIIGATGLILAFVYSDPVVCNADYRYQAFTFPWMGYGIGRGLCAFPKSAVWRKSMICFMVLYVWASLYFLTALYVRR